MQAVLSALSCSVAPLTPCEFTVAFGWGWKTELRCCPGFALLHLGPSLYPQKAELLLALLRAASGTWGALKLGGADRRG